MNIDTIVIVVFVLIIEIYNIIEKCTIHPRRVAAHHPRCFLRWGRSAMKTIKFQWNMNRIFIYKIAKRWCLLVDVSINDRNSMK